MKATLKINETPVEFFFDIEKGQPASFCSPEYSDQIIALDWIHTHHSKELNDAIWADLENIEAELLIIAQGLKKDAQYERVTGGLE